MKRTLLHVGCGTIDQRYLRGFGADEGWEEIRLDIAEEVKPDIVGSITDMSAVRSKSVNAVYSSHNIEHIPRREVPKALSEFYRVLKPDGFLVITCPDIVQIARSIQRVGLTGALYESSQGVIRPIDMCYGHQAAIARGEHYMAHKTAFSVHSLGLALQKAGFKTVEGQAYPNHTIWMVAMKYPGQQAMARAHAGRHFNVG